MPLRYITAIFVPCVPPPGAGYRLIIVKEKGCDVDVITQRLQTYIPDAELDQNVGAELSYVLPTAEVSKFEAMFLELEQKKAELKISSYGASQTTMDEVFLRQEKGGGWE